MRKLRQKMVRCSALQPLHQTTDCYLRRQRDRQMHVILRHVALHDRYLMLTADIPDQIPHPSNAATRRSTPPPSRPSPSGGTPQNSPTSPSTSSASSAASTKTPPSTAT